MELTAPKTSQRNQTADLLKGFAVILMIQVHILEQFSTQELYDSLAGKISLFLGGPFCAPVFMAVMGYFLAGTSKKTGYFVKRGALLFAGGLLLNTGRSVNLLFHVAREEFPINPLNYLFGADILTLAGLGLLLIPLLRPVLGKIWWTWFLAALAVATATPFLSSLYLPGSSISYPLSFFFGTAPWSYFPLFPWFSYILAGYSFALLPEKFMTPLRTYLHDYRVLLPVLIATIATIPWAASVTSDLQGHYYHHGLIFFLWVILFFAAWVPVVSLIGKTGGDNRLLQFIRWNGRNVTVVYVIQWLIIGNLATELYQTQGPAFSLLWFLVITTGTCLLAWVYKKMVRPGH